MKARAIAVASGRSNAVGTVEVECTPHGLALTYLGVGSFAEGYAPGPLTRDTHVLVPWPSVAQAELDGDQVYLRLEERLTPLNRLLLANFSTADAPHPAQAHRQRLLLRFALAAMFVLVVLAAGVAVPAVAPRAGATLIVVVGVGAALLLLGMGVFADHRLIRGATSSETARMLFVAEVARYLPHLSVSPSRMPRTSSAITIDSAQAMLPRSTAAIVITLTAGLLGTVLTASWILRERERTERREIAVAPPPPETVREERVEPPAPSPVPPPPPAPAVSAPAAPAAPATATVALPGGPCTCRRSDSVLWRSKIPRLSALLIERRERPHKDHVHLELEVGVVNNGRQDIDEVNLLVQFYERKPPGAKERTPTYDRPLFFEGPLRPGQAIKWHVEARGTEFDVLHSVEGSLDPGGTDAAPPDAFAGLLLEANHRPVRLHGAMMLGYLGDERARDGVIRLRDALREDEGPYLGRLLHALGDVITCDLVVTGKSRVRTLDVCVHNRTSEPKSDLFVRGRALDRPFDHSTPVAPPPLVIAEATAPVGAAVPAEGGVRVSVKLDTENPDGVDPVMFEAFAGAERDLY